MSVELEVSDNVATILLNRPEKLNAFTDGMWIQLRDCLDRCETDDAIRAVILTGAGRGFCAGADISGEGRIIERKTGIAGTVQMIEFYDAILRKIYHLPKPMIAAVHGATVGIAWSMALCCDWVIAAESAKFRPAFMNLAKVPEGGFQFLVARQIGEFKARDVAYRSRFLSGAEAFEMGLATMLADDEKLLDEANRLAAEAAGLAPMAFKFAKELFNANSGDFDGYLKMESQMIAIAANTSDAREGMAAFVEKRQANYTGV